MSDNVVITGGANATPLPGTVIATDQISNVHYQIVKLATGADGEANLVNSATPLNVTLPVAATDAFGRHRISAPETLFDSKQIFDNQPLFWNDAETSGSGTGSSHSTALAASTMTVSATTAGTRVRQTYQRFNYQPGKSQLAFLTGVLGAGASGITRRVGYFDDNNGLYFQLSGTTLSVVRRTKTSGSVVNNPTAQADWNVDPLDGTGASGITLDTSKAQIMVIDFEWLGVGTVRMGFVIDGTIYYCHQMNHANSLSTVYMSTPNLPVRFEIANDGTGAAASLIHICTTVISEGGAQENGVLGSISTSGTHLDADAADTLYALLGMRLKSTNLAAHIDWLDINVLTETATPFEWSVWLNPTVAGTFTYNDLTNYSVQFAAGATANTVSGGTRLAAGYVTASAQARGSAAVSLANARRLGSSISGTPDTLVLCVRPLAANADIQGSVNFREW